MPEHMHRAASVCACAHAAHKGAHIHDSYTCMFPMVEAITACNVKLRPRPRGNSLPAPRTGHKRPQRSCVETEGSNVGNDRDPYPLAECREDASCGLTRFARAATRPGAREQWPRGRDALTQKRTGPSSERSNREKRGAKERLDSRRLWTAGLPKRKTVPDRRLPSTAQRQTSAFGKARPSAFGKAGSDG